MKPDEILARILYRDALMLIIDKPAGLPVHAGPGGGANLEQYFDALRFGLPKPPSLAHRLDRDTSGCLILGRQHKGLSRLGRLFSQGLIAKTYWAVVKGCPAEPEGRVELALRKETRRNGWKMVPDRAGQAAVTDYRVLETDGALSWLELHPRTGRTHQIRVHCLALGCPIVGDPVYGRPDGAPPPQEVLHLHSRGIAVPLYEKKPTVAVTAPPPPHMKRTLEACGFPLPVD